MVALTRLRWPQRGKTIGFYKGEGGDYVITIGHLQREKRRLRDYDRTTTNQQWCFVKMVTVMTTSNVNE